MMLLLFYRLRAARTLAWYDHSFGMSTMVFSDSVRGDDEFQKHPLIDRFKNPSLSFTEFGGAFNEVVAVDMGVSGFLLGEALLVHFRDGASEDLKFGQSCEVGILSIVEHPLTFDLQVDYVFGLPEM